MEIQKQTVPHMTTKHKTGMEEIKKTPNKKLTMSYDHPVDERFPLVTLTLPQLYKLRANCTLDTGVTWHASAEELTYKQLYTQGMKLAKGLLALGLCRGETVLSVGVDGSESALLLIAASSIGVRFAAPYVYSPLVTNIGYHITNLRPKLIILGHAVTGYDLEDPYPEALLSLNRILNEDPSFPVPYLYRERGSLHTEPSEPLDMRLKKVEYIEKLMELGEAISDETLDTNTSEVTQNEPCFYTMSSGSTGVPKTIVIGAAFLVNGGSRRTERWNINEKSRMGCPSMCSEEIGFIEELACGFYTGHDILVLPAATDYDCVIMCREMLTAIQNHRTQLLYGDQYFLGYIVNNPSILEDFDVSCMTGIFLGGSGMSPSFKQSVLNVFPDSVDCYGLSELYYCTYPLLGSMKENLKTVGRISINGEVKVVDEIGNTVPVNTKGELWIRSHGLFLEYKDQPELTKRAKTPDGWFKTGDCAKLDECGQIEIIGRLASCERFKVLSDVVYAQPIEKTMMDCPKILDIIVVGRATGTPFGHELAYCIILKEKGSMTVEDVYKYATRNVECSSDWPLRVFFYDEFPRYGARNKTSRKALTKNVEEMVEKDFGVNFTDQEFLEQIRVATNH